MFIRSLEYELPETLAPCLHHFNFLLYLWWNVATLFYCVEASLLPNKEIEERVTSLNKGAVKDGKRGLWWQCMGMEWLKLGIKAWKQRPLMEISFYQKLFLKILGSGHPTLANSLSFIHKQTIQLGDAPQLNYLKNIYFILQRFKNYGLH